MPENTVKSLNNDCDILALRIDENHHRITELQERSRQVLAEIKEITEEITKLKLMNKTNE